MRRPFSLAARSLKLIGAVGLGVLLTVALPTTVLAAILATLSSTSGRPGDHIVLSTVGNPQAYDNLSKSTQPIYLISTADHDQLIAKFHGNVCATAPQRLLGQLTWQGGVGSLTFTIPDMKNSDYYFLIDVGEGASPSCWRMGGLVGGLTLTIGDQAAPQPAAINSPAASNGTGWTLILVALGSGLLVASIVAQRMRRRFWHP